MQLHEELSAYSVMERKQLFNGQQEAAASAVERQKCELIDSDRKGGDSNPQSNSFPDGYPIDLPTNLASSGSRLPDRGQFTYSLTKDDILEIEAALTAFKGMQS